MDPFRDGARRYDCIPLSRTTSNKIDIDSSGFLIVAPWRCRSNKRQIYWEFTLFSHHQLDLAAQSLFRLKAQRIISNIHQPRDVTKEPILASTPDCLTDTNKTSTSVLISNEGDPSVRSPIRVTRQEETVWPEIMGLALQGTSEAGENDVESAQTQEIQKNATLPSSPLGHPMHANTVTMSRHIPNSFIEPSFRKLEQHQVAEIMQSRNGNCSSSPGIACSVSQATDLLDLNNDSAGATSVEHRVKSLAQTHRPVSTYKRRADDGLCSKTAKRMRIMTNSTNQPTDPQDATQSSQLHVTDIVKKLVAQLTNAVIEGAKRLKNDRSGYFLWQSCKSQIQLVTECETIDERIEQSLNHGNIHTISAWLQYFVFGCAIQIQRKQGIGSLGKRNTGKIKQSSSAIGKRHRCSLLSAIICSLIKELQAIAERESQSYGAEVSLRVIPALAFGSSKSTMKLTQGNIRELGFIRDAATIKKVTRTAASILFQDESLKEMDSNLLFDPIENIKISSLSPVTILNSLGLRGRTHSPVQQTTSNSSVNRLQGIRNRDLEPASQS